GYFCIEILRSKLPARKPRCCGPGWSGLKELADPQHHSLSELAVRGNFSSVDREQRRLFRALVEDDFIVTGDILRLVSAVIIERAHTGERPHQLIGGNGVAEIAIYDATKIGDFLNVWHRGI